VSVRSASARVVLESEELSVSILAERGGKITSLYDRAHDREWLVSADHDLSGPADESAAYDEGDLCGWDEMLPTIAACHLPGTDIELPDHGELWRGSWDVVAESPRSVTMRASRDLGYSFERTMTLEGSALVVDYRIMATGTRTLELLWAAHPFVALRPDTRIVVEGVDEFIEVTDTDERARFEWPVDGLVVTEAIARSTGRKLFAHACEDRVGASFIDADGATITWNWASSDAPWLGLWLDNASLSEHVVAVVEPTNASDDSLEVASSANQSWALAPHEERRWRLHVSVPSELAGRERQERNKVKGN
jgi:galactose mutarotase-like enzyme